MEYDLFLFAGQSNMAGRGITSKHFPEVAPCCIRGAGYEFRAISDASKLYPIAEPFGVAENNPAGIYEPKMKTGSLVTAFVNAYYTETKIPIVGVSASKGGSSIKEWQPNQSFFRDSIVRFRMANTFFQQTEDKIRHKFIVWCQGETDGDHQMSKEDYKHYFKTMLDSFLAAGIEHCFMIQIGNYNGQKADIDYSEIIRAQQEICRTNSDVTMVSTRFEIMQERGLMKDDFHYFQQAYNEVGKEAGLNTAYFVLAK